MEKNTLQISYLQPYNGTKKSKLYFYDGSPDLVSVFKPGKSSAKKRLFITDGTTASLKAMQDFSNCFDDGCCGSDFLLVLGSGEAYKNIESVLTIAKYALENNLSRNDLFIAIGGGVICDITAFSASIYKRGIEVHLVPTTLLSMTDAAIGGKTGCDFNNLKNPIGTFYPAKTIYYWTSFVQSLNDEQYNSGLAAAFRLSLVANKELYEIFKNQSQLIKNRNQEVINNIIKACITTKAEIVKKDLTEKKERWLLNYANTFAYAYESIAGTGVVAHGQAIAWGIARQVELSFKKDYCKEALKNEIFSILEDFGWETNPIPSEVKGGGITERFIKTIMSSKSDKIQLLMLKDIQNANMEDISTADLESVLK